MYRDSKTAAKLCATTWNYRRRITCLKTGNLIAKGTGTVRFAPKEDNAPKYLIYEEVGILEMNGSKCDCNRSYYYDFGDGDPGTLDIKMHDTGKTLARFPLPISPGRSVKSIVEHKCGADLYNGQIFVEKGNSSSWRLIYDVAGPAKAYRTDTLYENT